MIPEFDTVPSPAPARSSGTRVEESYRRILSLITEGRLSDGERLPSESDLASQFGVSRPVVRQALTRLQGAGLIEVRWGSGSYVRNAASAAPEEPSFGPARSLNEVRDVFEFRAAIEGEAAALAALRRDPAAIATAEAALDGLSEALGNDALGYDADLEFHFAIAVGSGNPYFERVMRSIRKPLGFCVSLARTLSMTHPRERLLLVQSEHVAVLDAVKAGDAEAARQAMRHHLLIACERVFQGPAASS